MSKPKSPLGATILLVGVVANILSGVWLDSLGRTKPDSPNVDSGEIYPIQNRGTIFVTGDEYYAINVLRYGSTAILAIGGGLLLLAQFRKRDSVE